MWRHAHKDESIHTWRTGSHVGEWEQITGSEERGNTDQTITEPAPPLQLVEQCTGINHHNSCHIVNRQWDCSFRSVGVCNPAGYCRGWCGGCCPLSQHCITKEQRVSLRLLPGDIHKVFQQQSRQHSHTVRKLRWTKRKKLQGELQSRCFGYIL